MQQSRAALPDAAGAPGPVVDPDASPRAGLFGGSDFLPGEMLRGIIRQPVPCA